MPNKLRNSHSWFCRTRRGAGFRTVAGLAQELGVPKITVFQWEWGSAHRPPSNRPQWEQMLRLKDSLHVQLGELVGHLWGEKVEDPCPCGCGGRKTFPTSQTTHKLLIKLPCAKCGVQRTYPQGKRDRHRKLCPTCASSVERIEFTCIGYQDHSDADTDAAFWLPAVAVGMGLDILEKHITHDRSLKSIDHEAALNPEEFSRFVTMVREIEAAKGIAIPKPFSADELKYQKYAKKSIVARQDLPAGSRVTENDLLFMRSDGIGLPPDQAYRLIGRVTNRGIAAYYLILEDDVT